MKNINDLIKSKKRVLIVGVTCLLLITAGAILGIKNLSGYFVYYPDYKHIRMSGADNTQLPYEDTTTKGFVAEIRLLPYGFEPEDWILADGRSFKIQDNTELYSLLASQKYNNGGSDSFNIPDLRGKAPVPKQTNGQNMLDYYICETGIFIGRGADNSKLVNSADNAFYWETIFNDNEFFLGEIWLLDPNNYPRKDDSYWPTFILCDGRELPVNYNQALFSLLGTRFGGDGKKSFRIPDLTGKEPVDGYKYFICAQGIYPSRHF